MLYIPKLENKSPMGRITGSENNLLSSGQVAVNSLS